MILGSLIGFFIGGFCGMFVMALCTASGRNNDDK